MPPGTGQAKQHTGSSQLTWSISQRTLLDARFGIWRFNYDGTSQDGTESNPAFFDEFSGYEYGRWPAGRDGTDKRNYNGSVALTHFVDDWGGSHELKGGIEYQDMNGGFYFSSQNSISQWRTYDNNLYYYRGLLGLSGPDPVRGDGRLTLLTASTAELGSGVPGAVLARGRVRVGHLARQQPPHPQPRPALRQHAAPRSATSPSRPPTRWRSRSAKRCSCRAGASTRSAP